MKRDMDLVRAILSSLNDHEHGYAPQKIEIDGYTSEQIGYHCLLLGEAGLIQVADSLCYGESSPSAIPVRLTWQGHEFIDNASSEQVWSEAKTAVEKVGDASFSVWASVLAQLVSKSLGI